MSRRKRFYYWSLSLTSLVAFISLIFLPKERAFGQIVPDNTLGTENSVVTPNVEVRASAIA